MVDHVTLSGEWVFLGPLARAAELDQDGRDDLVVGAPWTPEPDVLDMFGEPSKKGAVYLYWGGGG